MTVEWAEAIGAVLDGAGVPTYFSVAKHIRAALRISGSLRRGQITKGLNEAYGPFQTEPSLLRGAVDRALSALVLIGDLTELNTAAGAAYLLTPPRLVAIDAEHGVLLGASEVEPDSDRVSRLLDAPDWPSEKAVLRINLRQELGLPDWRIYLVESGGVDAPLDGPEALFLHAARRSVGGDRLTDLSPEKIRVLSGRQTYFGRHDSLQLEGRWRPAEANGSFCAVRYAGYTWRPCVVTIHDGGGSLWDCENWDLWRWAVVGQTRLSGAPIFTWESATDEIVTFVPLPRQFRRLLAMAAEPLATWRWRCSRIVALEAAGLATVTIEP